MIEHQLTNDGILVVRPSGPLDSSDFDGLRERVDELIEAGGSLRGLLIEAPDFPGWRDLAGFTAHLRFVREHHRQLPRVAFVSDGRFARALPKLARHFVAAELQRFPASEREQALEWLRTPLPAADHAIRHAWFPEQRLFWIRVDGRIHTDEYRKLLAWMEPLIEAHAPVSFLVDLDELDGVDLGAMIADFRFAVSHLRKIRRIALVGDEEWSGRIASLPNPFSLEIKAFGDSDEEAAWDWLAS